MSKNTYASVWDALTDTPAESAKMKARSEMLMAVKRTVESWKLTQARSAERLGVTQPRLNDLLRGRVTKFSTDALFDLSAAAGLTPTITIDGVRRGGVPGTAAKVRVTKRARGKAAATA